MLDQKMQYSTVRSESRSSLRLR